MFIYIVHKRESVFIKGKNMIDLKYSFVKETQTGQEIKI